MVLVNCTEEMISLQERLDISVLPVGSDVKGSSVEAVELGPDGLVEKEED